MPDVEPHARTFGRARGAGRDRATAGRHGPDLRRRGASPARARGRPRPPARSGAAVPPPPRSAAAPGPGRSPLRSPGARPAGACSSRGSRTARRCRAGTRPCPRSRSPPRGAAATPAAQSAARCAFVERRARRLLDHLLVAPLDRALALEQVERCVPCASAMTCTSTWRGRSTKRSSTIASSPNAERASRREVASAAGSPRPTRTTRMPLPPPPREGLIISGQPTRGRLGRQGRVVLRVAVVARKRRARRRRHQPARALLVAHQSMHGPGRADEREPGRGHRVREVAVLAQEAVARDGSRPRRRFSPRRRARRCRGTSATASAGPIEDRLVRLARVQRARVRLGVDGDRANPHRSARARHAHGDLAAVGDQDLAEEASS